MGEHCLTLNINNMKQVVMGDIHGHDTWKKILAVESDYDEVIFLGDYLDSFGVDKKTQLLNLKEILEIPRSRMLLGNHDLHYIFSEYKCSGFTTSKFNTFNKTIKKAYFEGKIKPLHIDGDIIFSHAGVTNRWLENKTKHADLEDYMTNNINLDTLGFQYSPDEIKERTCYYGNNTFQGFLWVRPESLLSDKLTGYRQIVGHTFYENIKHEDGVYFCDSLGGETPEYIVIENGVITPKKLELSL